MAEPASPSNLPHPPGYYRWAVLIVASLAMAGNYYVYDSISPLADLLKEQLHFTDANLGTLNGIYSVPNILMVALGGVLIDRIGTRRSTLIFAAICFLGAVITAATNMFLVMALGRLIFGLGAESLIVAVTTALAKWFRGKELSFAFGLNLTIARLGSFAALNSPSWAKPAFEHWQWPLIISAAAGAVCLIGAISYAGMEWSGTRRYCLGHEEETEKIKFTDIFRFPVSYWYVVLLCVTFYSAMFPFQTFAVKFFMETHEASREYAGFLSSILTLFAMICTPAFGYLADRIGRRATMMVFGSLLLIPVYLIMVYTRVPLIFPMAIMGVSFSLIPAVMWPSVAYLVDQAKLGSALGLMTMIQNIGLAGFNFLIGWSNDRWDASASNPNGYAPGMWMFSSLGFFALLFSFLLQRSETGPNAKGLETITTKSSQSSNT